MISSQRDQRLKDEYQRLTVLDDDSTVLSLEATGGEPPTKYIFTFKGRGITRSLSSRAKIQQIDEHRVELRIPYAFPERPPDVRWLTSIYHPNISFSGLVKLRDIGLPWEEAMSLDVVCERLWDVARLAYFDEEHASNYAAKRWIAEQTEVRLPVDARPLRDKSMPSSSNVIRYQRKGAAAMRIREPESGEEVFYIGEDTPTPDIPYATIVPEEEVFFIGE